MNHSTKILSVLLSVTTLMCVILVGFVVYYHNQVAELKNRKETETIFVGDHEGNRFHYDGNVFVGVSDNELIIKFEDLKTDDFNK